LISPDGAVTEDPIHPLAMTAASRSTTKANTIRESFPCDIVDQNIFTYQKVMTPALTAKKTAFIAY
jgi:hypothetical protein